MSRISFCGSAIGAIRISTALGASPPIARSGAMATRFTGFATRFARIAIADVAWLCSATHVQHCRAPSRLTQYSRASRIVLTVRDLFSRFCIARFRANQWNTEAPPIPRTTTPEPDGDRDGSRPWRNFIPFASRVALPRPTASAEVSMCATNSNWPDRRAPLPAKSCERTGLSSFPSSVFLGHSRFARNSAYLPFIKCEALAQHYWN